MGKQMQFKPTVILKNSILLITVLVLTVLVNWPVVTFDMMYVEQATIYNANQAIHSVADLLNVYLHPQMLDFMVPFFRPSGHFLMYQILTPFIGWYNTKALLIINLLFLGLIGYMMIKLYDVLFPGLKAGGYIAFAIYLMNPALLIAKVTLMHFEYAYVFFTLWSLYCFVLFCQQNLSTTPSLLPVKFKHTTLLLSALLLYFVAITFKEPAIMLAPVLMSYFVIMFYKPGYVLQNLRNKDVISVFVLLTTVSISLALYITMSWQKGFHPLLNLVSLKRIWFSIQKFSVYLFSLNIDYFGNNSGTDPLLHISDIPLYVRYIIWSALAITAVSLLNLIRSHNTERKKPVLFLVIALLAFLLLPLWWSMGFGWHLSLSLVCEALIMGFGIEFYARHFCTSSVVKSLGIVLALLIGLTTYQIDQRFVNLVAQSHSGFVSRLNYNAVFHPPVLKSLLNKDSILVVQDDASVGDYHLGNSTFPIITFVPRDGVNFDTLFTVNQHYFFWMVHPVYNGTLFHWAYQSMQFNEEVVAFSDNNMSLVPDAILLSWVRHGNNIFCVAFDKSGNWFDHTITFKKNILLEQKRRHLLVSRYHVLPATALHSASVLFKQLPYADPELCETICDNTRHCKGFTYNQVIKGYKTLAQCFFYHKITADKQPCQVCTGYIQSA
jgi:hypothetical protein